MRFQRLWFVMFLTNGERKTQKICCFREMGGVARRVCGLRYEEGRLCGWGKENAPTPILKCVQLRLETRGLKAPPFQASAPAAQCVNPHSDRQATAAATWMMRWWSAAQAGVCGRVLFSSVRAKLLLRCRQRAARDGRTLVAPAPTCAGVASGSTPNYK